MYRISYSPDTASASLHRKPQSGQSEAGLKAGHPAVWRDGKLFEEACSWLNEEIVAVRRSQKTWAQAANSLLTWLDFLEVTEIDWRHAATKDLVAYRDAYLVAISPKTGKGYSDNTVSVRMTYIIDFINYAVRNGWIDSDLRGSPITRPIQSSRTPFDQDDFAYILQAGPGSDNGGGVASDRLNKLKPRAGQNDTVKVLSREELTALRRWAGPRPSERQPNDGGSDRDYIVLAFGWACGLRVQEIADISVLPILGISVNAAMPGQMHKLAVQGKGRKTRMIDIPAWLVLDLHAYIEGERKRSLRKRGQRAEDKQLILNSEHSTRPGQPMTKAGMQNLMKRACAGAGLMTQDEKFNVETGEAVAFQVAKYSMHCLRHTYAVMTYHNHLKSAYAELEAWQYVQMQLGHNSPKTTIKTYLNHLAVWRDYRSAQNLLQMVR